MGNYTAFLQIKQSDIIWRFINLDISRNLYNKDNPFSWSPESLLKWKLCFSCITTVISKTNILEVGVNLWSTILMWSGSQSDFITLRWRHNGHDGVSNHQSHHCLLSRLIRRRSKKHQSSALLTFVRGIHRWPVNSPHKWPVTRKYRGLLHSSAVIKYAGKYMAWILYLQKWWYIYSTTTRCVYLTR